MPRFRAPMISRTCGQRRETARFAWRKSPFVFPVFSARRGPKRKDREINGGFRGSRGGSGLARRTCAARRLGNGAASRWNRSKRTRKWRRLAPDARRENRSGELRISPSPARINEAVILRAVESLRNPVWPRIVIPLGRLSSSESKPQREWLPCHARPMLNIT
jgi:hypothetical protein